MLINSFTMLERRGRGECQFRITSESPCSCILVTCSKIHERLLHCGIGEKREKERGIRGRDQRERERGEGGGMQILTNSESQLSDTSCLYKVLGQHPIFNSVQILYTNYKYYK